MPTPFSGYRSRSFSGGMYIVGEMGGLVNRTVQSGVVRLAKPCRSVANRIRILLISNKNPRCHEHEDPLRLRILADTLETKKRAGTLVMHIAHFLETAQNKCASVRDGNR